MRVEAPRPLQAEVWKPHRIMSVTSFGQSKSKGQPRSSREGRKDLHCLMEGAVKISQPYIVIVSNQYLRCYVTKRCLYVLEVQKAQVDGPEVASAIGQHISANSDGENPKWLTETLC